MFYICYLTSNMLKWKLDNWGGGIKMGENESAGKYFTHLLLLPMLFSLELRVYACILNLKKIYYFMYKMSSYSVHNNIWMFIKTLRYVVSCTRCLLTSFIYACILNYKRYITSCTKCLILIITKNLKNEDHPCFSITSQVTV